MMLLNGNAPFVAVSKHMDEWSSDLEKVSLRLKIQNMYMNLTINTHFEYYTQNWVNYLLKSNLITNE